MYRATGKIVLASHSPRRREFLKTLGIEFSAVGTDVDESISPGESVPDHVIRLSRQKALAAAQKERRAFVLGADTLVVVDGVPLGKPSDRADASRMLGLLSGGTHRVISGFCLIAPGGKNEITGVVETLVTMRELGAPETAAYIETGEPMDKAGAYAVQGLASAFITKIDGSYTNVVGLPVAEVVNALLSLGAIEVA